MTHSFGFEKDSSVVRQAKADANPYCFKWIPRESSIRGGNRATRDVREEAVQLDTCFPEGESILYLDGALGVPGCRRVGARRFIDR